MSNGTRSAVVAPTSTGQAHFNTLAFPQVRLRFSWSPVTTDRGIPGAEYKVWTDQPSLGGTQISSGTSAADGVVTIPWAPKPATARADEFMVLEMFDTLYKVTLRDPSPIDPANPGLTPLEMVNASSPGPSILGAPSARLRAVQERLDILGYLTGYLDNEGDLQGLFESSTTGRNDEKTEQAILNYQQDFMLDVHGLPDAATVTALLALLASVGYPNNGP